MKRIQGLSWVTAKENEHPSRRAPLTKRRVVRMWTEWCPGRAGEIAESYSESPSDVIETKAPEGM
jgi:hypothetical protein